MSLDSTSGLYYVRARTYDTRTGRFTTKDPVAGARSLAESLHPYALDHNAPTVWRDPSGRFSIGEAMESVTNANVQAGIGESSYAGFFGRARVRKLISEINIVPQPWTAGQGIADITADMIGWERDVINDSPGRIRSTLLAIADVSAGNRLFLKLASPVTIYAQGGLSGYHSYREAREVYVNVIRNTFLLSTLKDGQGEPVGFCVPFARALAHELIHVAYNLRSAEDKEELNAISIENTIARQLDPNAPQRPTDEVPFDPPFGSHICEQVSPWGTP